MGKRRKRNPYAKPDRFTRQARAEGYAARSVYKLTEIQRRFPFLKRGDRVLDLGCSPGSWMLWAYEQVGRKGQVVGVDIADPEIEVGTIFVQDVFEMSLDVLREALGGPADVVLSDMAPRTTGNVLGDHVRQIEIAQRAIDLGTQLLKPGGHMVVKVFDGEDAHGFVQGIRPLFTKVKRLKPEAVRRESREFFVVCLGFKGSPAHPELVC